MGTCPSCDLHDLVANKNALRDVIAPSVTLLDEEKGSQEEQRSALYRLHQAITDHLNDLDRKVLESEISVGSTDPRRRLDLAETVHNALDCYIAVFERIQADAERLQIDGSNFRPSKYAFAASQRLIAEVLPEGAQELQAAFMERGLPVTGFNASRSRNEGREPATDMTTETLRCTQERAIARLLRDTFSSSTTDLYYFLRHNVTPTFADELPQPGQESIATYAARVAQKLLDHGALTTAFLDAWIHERPGREADIRRLRPLASRAPAQADDHAQCL